MKPRVVSLATASGMGLAHLYCHKCEGEELHHKQRCVHCGTRRPAVEYQDEPNWRQRSKVAAPKSSQFKAGNPSRNKLTEIQVRAIRRADGSCTQIAKQYGVSVGCVSNIKLGKSWR